MNNNEVLIVGAGLTGLSLAHFLKKHGIKTRIIDKSDRPGGVINTIREDGFIYESGPNTGVLSSYELVSLFEDLRDNVTLETARKAAEKRYILKNNKWEALPSGLISALSTPLFTLKDKFGILGEPFRKPGNNPYESVADMVVRRLGKSYLDYAVDPFISGIYAGDPKILATSYALPKLYALEQNYGSFIKGTIAKSRIKKTPEEMKVTKQVFSAEGGLGNLISALVLSAGESNISCGISDLKILPEGRLFRVSWNSSNGSGNEELFPVVVTTTGAYSLPQILPFADRTSLEPLLQLNYARVVQVAAGYTEWKGLKLDAFGALVPGMEKKNILGILFPSAIFKDRAPVNGALLSVFMGGMKRPDIYSMSDNEIVSIVLDTLELTMKTEQVPDLLRIFRYEHAIPQYDKSTGSRLEAIGRIEREYPGLILAGNIRDGIGMSDRVKQAARIADQIKIIFS